MPTYEYACKSCGEHLEVVQSFRDDPLDTCPACGGELRKVFGAIGVVLKGSGFYRNDHRSSAKSGSDSKADTGSSSSSSSSTSGSGSSTSGSGSSGSGSSGSSGSSEAKSA